MALMSEEVALLVELGISQLCIAENINESPSEEEKQNIKICEQKYVIQFYFQYSTNVANICIFI